MTSLNELLLRFGYALRTHPWVRALAGLVLIAIGVVELIVGAGHGRIIAFGVLLVAGSLLAVRSARPPLGRGEEHADETTASPGADHPADQP